MYVRDKLCLKWDEIAEMPEFRGIPKQTLNQIYHGKRDVPKKYRARLGEPDTAPAPVCAVHGVVHCYDCAKQVVKDRDAKPKEYKRWGWLWDMPKAELVYRMDNREASK